MEDLVPDKTKYKADDHSEMRQLQQDTDKIYELAAKAYALVKSRFKPNSQAAAVIQPAEETGRLDELWKLFLLHYDNPVTKAGADRLIRAFYDKPSNPEIINLFLIYTEHFNKIDQITAYLVQPQNAARSLVDVLTPKKLLQTPIADRTTSVLGGASSAKPEEKTATTFPQWARVLHALYRIKTEVTKYSKIISRFLYEYIDKANNQKLEDLTIEHTLEQLKSFLMIHSDTEKAVALLTKPGFYCEVHGKNSTHDTKGCRAIKAVKERSKSGRSENYSRSNFRSRSRERHNERRGGSRERRNYDHRSNSRDRDYKRRHYSDIPREIRREERRRSSSPYPHKRPQSDNMKSHSAYTTYARKEKKEEPEKKEILEKDNEDKLFSLSDYTVVLHTTFNKKRWSEDDSEIISDSGASEIIFNLVSAYLATELEPLEGSIEGANGTQLGAIVAVGYTEFMGVRVRCYVADIAKSVVSIGLLTQQYDFDVLFTGGFMHIYSQRSGETSSVLVNDRNLFPIPETLFQSPKINVHMTCLSADSLSSLWHHRLGHLNDRKLAYMGQQKKYRDRGLKFPESQAKRVHLEEYCDCCNRAKGHKVRSTKEVDKDNSEVGVDWHVDVLGRQDIPALVTHHLTFIMFTDRKTRFRYGFGLLDNGEDEIILAVDRWDKKCLTRVRAWYKDKYDRIPFTLLSDNLEFRYSKVQVAVAKLGFQQFFTAPRHSSSNGVAERGFGIIRTMARAIMTARDLP